MVISFLNFVIDVSCFDVKSCIVINEIVQVN